MSSPTCIMPPSRRRKKLAKSIATCKCLRRSVLASMLSSPAGEKTRRTRTPIAGKTPERIAPFAIQAFPTCRIQNHSHMQYAQAMCLPAGARLDRTELSERESRTAEPNVHVHGRFGTAISSHSTKMDVARENIPFLPRNGTAQS